MSQEIFGERCGFYQTYLSRIELGKANPTLNAIEVIANAYAGMHAEKNFSHFIEKDTGHVLSEEMWKRTIGWFDQHLRPGDNR